MGLSNIEKFLMAQAIESSVRDDVLDVMRLAFVDKGINSEVKSAYQPVISKNFNDSHFKMTLPVIKEFADRIEASLSFSMLIRVRKWIRFLRSAFLRINLGRCILQEWIMSY